MDADALQLEPPPESPEELLERFGRDTARAAAMLPTPSNFPPPPAGWRQANSPAPGIATYEVARLVRPDDPKTPGPGMDVCGLNATEFHGFPPETLSIGGVSVSHFRDAEGVSLRLGYRFHYRADGWQQVHAGRIPVCDFHRLPWGTD